MVGMSIFVLPKEAARPDPSVQGHHVPEAADAYRIGNYVFMVAGVLLLGFLGAVHVRLRRADATGTLATVALAAGALLAFGVALRCGPPRRRLDAADKGTDVRLLAGWDSGRAVLCWPSALPRVFRDGDRPRAALGRGLAVAAAGPASPSPFCSASSAPRPRSAAPSSRQCCRAARLAGVMVRSVLALAVDQPQRRGDPQPDTPRSFLSRPASLSDADREVCLSLEAPPTAPGRSRAMHVMPPAASACGGDLHPFLGPTACPSGQAAWPAAPSSPAWSLLHSATARTVLRVVTPDRRSRITSSRRALGLDDGEARDARRRRHGASARTVTENNLVAQRQPGGVPGRKQHGRGGEPAHAD